MKKENNYELIIFAGIVFLLFVIFSVFYIKAGNIIMTGRVISNLERNCSIDWMGNDYQGIHNNISFTNTIYSENRFVCFDSRFYECGWELDDEEFAVKVKQGDQIGNWRCDLNNKKWIYVSSMIEKVPFQEVEQDNQQIFNFDFKGQEYNLRIIEIIGDKASVELDSRSFILEKGISQNLDLDGDDKNDVVLVVKNISSENVDIGLRYINEKELFLKIAIILVTIFVIGVIFYILHIMVQNIIAKKKYNEEKK